MQLLVHRRSSSGGAVRVVFPDGNLRIYRKPLKAADLMVENPGQFVYFLLPVDLPYSVLTQEEMKHATFNIGKLITDFCIFPFEAKTAPQSSAGDGVDGSDERFSKQGSWKPALKTILETPSL
ncbi:hypothetical protein F3Y22_tig00006613pilonHSYRG00059 [Hibiscus syriacus]|uniref:Uncharacterized protein n=1 Tax=Hibiscus syriacus TaxID=106335 RepID=A0A6A3CD97_HIBSY|nr:hypothetical protein F3Y22_tig00006613pilonHSYRG00059 [Hibiscus syriacus]